LCQDRVISGSDETAKEARRLAEKRAFDRLAERVGDARPDVRAEAAISLGRSGQDRGALAAIDELLHVPAHPKRYHLVAAVEKLCKSVDAEISSRAAAVATRFIRRNLAIAALLSPRPTYSLMIFGIARMASPLLERPTNRKSCARLLPPVSIGGCAAWR
jgi:hypothetical protein